MSDRTHSIAAALTWLTIAFKNSEYNRGKKQFLICNLGRRRPDGIETAQED